MVELGVCQGYREGQEHRVYQDDLVYRGYQLVREVQEDNTNHNCRQQKRSHRLHRSHNQLDEQYDFQRGCFSSY